MDKNTLTELNIPNMLLEICPDEKTVKGVSYALEALEQDKTAIIQRQREMADFINNPELLSILLRQTRRLDELKEQQKKERLSVAKSRAQSAHNAAKEQLGPLMGSILLIIKHAEECVKLYTDLPVYLRDFAFTSDFLLSFKKSLVKIIDGGAQKKLTAFFKDIQNLQSTGSWHQTNISVAYTMDDSFSKLYYRISKLTFNLTPGSMGRKVLRKDNLLKFLRKNENKRKEDEFEVAEDFFSLSILGGLTHIMDILSLFTQNLQKPFERVQKDLHLYKFGMALATRYNSRNISWCFPEILEPGSQTRISGSNSPDIQPLTLRYGGDGVDHFQFVQEFALLQLFAQAGLPIAAGEAQIAIVSGLFAQFASNELVLGRFEEEAREMSSLCRKIKPHGLVLFHEVFQSTAYEEIAEPFAQIVEYLASLPCTIVLVTHNSFLAERLNS